MELSNKLRSGKYLLNATVAKHYMRSGDAGQISGDPVVKRDK